MEPHVSPGTEVARLRRCVRDLVSVLALPAMWSCRDPSQIGRTLLDVLPEMLQLDLLYVQVHDVIGQAGSPRAWIAPSVASVRTEEIAEALRRSLGANLQQWPSLGKLVIGDISLTVVPLRIGLQGELGVIVAGARRADFPEETERLLLTVATNQAVLGLHDARLLNEQRRVTTELERRVARITSLGALTASIAHEVNQPLFGILTNAGTCLRMLGADPPNIEGARETARRTIRDGNRASEVITKLRALYNRKAFTPQLVDLNEAAREVIALSMSDLQRNRVVLRTEFALGLPLVTGDRVQLQEVVLNLLRNASDAMSAVRDRPRALLVRTDRDAADRVRLSVQDVGVGFEPEAADRLFAAFYTTKHDGMGMGLSVSRSIIERHGGRLWATPNHGPGATFAFSLPRDLKAPRRTRRVESVRPPARDRRQLRRT
ncbi:MAG: sensor histidine kinase [Gemmatimonadales bacterium]